MKELFDNYYEESFSQSKSQNLDLKTFELNARKFRWNYKRFFLNLPKDAKILDFGCGIGQFLFYLKKEGFQNITGIDISKSQIDLALRMQPDVDFRHIEDTFQFIQGNKEMYDVVVLNDVLEHLEKENIIPFFKSVHDAIKPNGLFIVKTINSAYPLGNSSRYLDFTHTISFHEKSLTQIFHHAGFINVFSYQEEIGLYNPLFAIKKLFVISARYFVKILVYLTESDWPHIISQNLIVSGVKE